MRRDPFALYREGRVRSAPGNAAVAVADADADASAGIGAEAARKKDKSSSVSGARGGTGHARDSRQKARDKPELSSHHTREILV